MASVWLDSWCGDSAASSTNLNCAGARRTFSQESANFQVSLRTVPRLFLIIAEGSVRAWLTRRGEPRGWRDKVHCRATQNPIPVVRESQVKVHDYADAASTMTTAEIVEMRGKIVRWDGKHGVIRTDAGVEVDFFPVHLAANGYTDRVKVGDRIHFRCNVISTRSYCLDLIRAVAVS